LIEEATQLKTQMQTAVDEDAAAFKAYMQARKLPRDTDQQKSTRIEAIHTASINAAKVPLHVARTSLKVLQLAVTAAEIGNLNAISDAGAAGAFASAALQSAGLNVRINLPGLETEPLPAEMLNELKNLEKQAEHFSKKLKQGLNERGGLNLS